MNEWKNEWMNERTNEWMNRKMNEWMNEWRCQIGCQMLILFLRVEFLRVEFVIMLSLLCTNLCLLPEWTTLTIDYILMSVMQWDAMYLEAFFIKNTKLKKNMGSPLDFARKNLKFTYFWKFSRLRHSKMGVFWQSLATTRWFNVLVKNCSTDIN